MPVTKESIAKVSDEMTRLVNRIKDLLARAPEGDSAWWAATKETAAVRRSSMDLTRALADLRKT